MLRVLFCLVVLILWMPFQSNDASAQTILWDDEAGECSDIKFTNRFVTDGRLCSPYFYALAKSSTRVIASRHCKRVCGSTKSRAVKKHSHKVVECDVKRSEKSDKLRVRVTTKLVFSCRK